MTRLSFRNLPKNVTEKDLRKICMDAAKNRGEKVLLKQVKILVEDKTESAKSKGIGFVEFVEHAQALRTLRNGKI
jgi:nucleolar protein 4